MATTLDCIKKMVILADGDEGIDEMKYSSPVDTSQMLPIEQIAYSDMENIDEVMKLSDEAKEFLRSKAWCRGLIDGWLDWGWGYILGVFYFHVEPRTSDVPDYIWVIVGDMPPAYFDARDYPNRRSTVMAYIREMQKWIECVMNDKNIDESIIHVNVPPEKEWARRLQTRLNFMSDKLLPYL